MNAKLETDGLRAAPMADYMKIRQYVVTLAERGSSAPAMIPSMTELARRFGVTRMTVHKALKGLIRDQYLVVRKGVGTFIAPTRGKGAAQPYCFGLVVGNGKHCFYDAFYWRLLSAFGLEITDKGYRVNILNLSGSTSEELANEVKDNWVDGLVWIGPWELGGQTLKLLHDGGFPVVAVHSPVDGVNNVRMDGGGHAYETVRALLAEGRRNIVFATLTDDPSVRTQLDGLRRAFAEAGVKLNERLVLKDFSRVQEDLEEILEFGIDVQAVYSTAPQLPQILTALRKHGVDLKDKCRLVVEPFFLDKAEGFEGVVREYRFAEEAALAVAMLERMLETHDFSVETKLLEFKIRTVTGGRDS